MNALDACRPDEAAPPNLTLYKSPMCCTTNAAIGKGKLQLLFASPHVITDMKKVSDRGVYCGKDGHHVWLQPHVYIPDMTKRPLDEAFVVASWFVEGLPGRHQLEGKVVEEGRINCAVVWKAMSGTSGRPIPFLTNTRALKAGERLYRLIGAQYMGTAPAELGYPLIKEVRKIEKEKEQEKEKDSDAQAKKKAKK